MVLSKRERVIRALERDGEPDIIPIQSLGFEKTSKSRQEFLHSNEYKAHETHIKNNYSKNDYNWAGDITEQRFWNVDCHAIDPWKDRMKGIDFADSLLGVGLIAPGPSEHPDSFIATPTGRVWKATKQIKTGIDYWWYLDGVFRTFVLLSILSQLGIQIIFYVIKFSLMEHSAPRNIPYRISIQNFHALLLNLQDTNPNPT